MEQHSLGVADRCQVMLVILPGPLLAVAAGGGEHGQVGPGEVLQASSGLDQQPRRHLRAGAEPDPCGEPQVGCSRGEPVQIGCLSVPV
jgi:hypothetical protein